MTGVIEALAVNAIKNVIKRKVKKAMLRKLIREGGVAAAVVGVISLVLGVDIAPEDVDKVITGAAVIAIYAPQIIDAIKARLGKKDQ